WMTAHAPCPVALSGITDAATVVSLNTDAGTVVVTPATARIAGWYKAGVLVAPDGDKRFVLDDTVAGANHTLTVLQNFPSTTLKAGDACTVVWGDDHLYATCRDKFGADTGTGAAFGGNNLQANVNPHVSGRVQ
ncbi:MAG: phage BR0599 family protein, partial [Acidobacteria bacterium]|nr:phage BR0599 family protein [Acidobacteriota bacterium]